MKAVHFDLNGSICTWYGFWFGFGINASILLMLAAVASWQLDKVQPAQWRLVEVIAWTLVAAMLANTILSWMYFFVVPGVFATLSTVLIATGAWRKRS
jgi:hypothetical protein